MICPLEEERGRAQGWGLEPSRDVYELRNGADAEVREVLLQAMAKKITWWQAAEIIGVIARTMRRWRERLEEHGYDGLADRREGVVFT